MNSPHDTPPLRYTLGQAAKYTGKSKSTIRDAVKSGRISAISVGKTGYELDPSDVHRVYKMIAPRTDADSDKTNSTAPTEEHQEPHEKARMTALEQEVIQLQQKLRNQKEDTDRRERELQAQCDQWHEQATAITRLLTDERTEVQKREDMLRQEATKATDELRTHYENHMQEVKEMREDMAAMPKTLWEWMVRKKTKKD